MQIFEGMMYLLNEARYSSFVSVHYRNFFLIIRYLQEYHTKIPALRKKYIILQSFFWKKKMKKKMVL